MSNNNKTTGNNMVKCINNFTKSIGLGLCGLSLALASQSSLASQELEYRLAWDYVTDEYQVFMRPLSTPSPDASMTGQVTVKVPYNTEADKFLVDQLASTVTDTEWSVSASVYAPTESISSAYLSFMLTPQVVSAFNWQANQEIKVFSFKNSAACLGDATLIDNVNDAFAQLPNSVNISAANQFTNLGWGSASDNNYKGNYGDAVADCTLSHDDDGDGLKNGYEIAIGTNPNIADSDADGLDDGDEVTLSTDPLNPDSDGDGLFDGVEVGSNPATPINSDTDTLIDALDNDDDGDNILSADEQNDPNQDGSPSDAVDTDQDGLADYLDDQFNPVITSSANPTIIENQTSVITVTGLTGTAGKTFAITGGDDQGGVEIDASTGELSFKAPANFENPLDGNADNVYIIEVTLSDDNADTAVQIVSITVTNINDAPTAAGETLNTAEDTPVSESIGGDINDEDSDTLTFSLASDVQNGSLYFNTATGDYSYTPASQFYGQDSFTYRVTDPAGESATAEVVITVAPVDDSPLVFLNTNAGVESVLDWNTLNWSAGQVSNFIVDGVGVNMNIGGTASYVSVSDNTNITGGLGAAEQSLNWTIDPADVNETGRLVINFDRPVANVSFSLLDIDSGNLNPSSQMEQLDVEALFVGQAVPATLTPVNSAAVTVTGSQAIAAAASPIASDSNSGNVDVVFTGLVDTIVINFGSQAGANANPSWLDFGLSDIRFEKVQSDTTALFIEHDPALLVNDASAAVFDMQEDDIASMSIVFMGLSDGVDEVISILGETFPLDADKTATISNGTTDILVTYSNTDSTFVVTEAASGMLPDEVLTDLVLSVTYENTSHTPTEGDRSLRFVATDAGGLSSDVAITTIMVEAINDAPIITSEGGGDNAVIAADENQTAIATIESTDYESDTIMYSVSGGADAALFVIDPATGVLSFINSPDFEAPQDLAGDTAENDNVYELEVSATDNGNPAAADVQRVQVTVNNVNDAPVITSLTTATVDENQTAAITVTASDQDAGDNLSFELTGGDDQALFSIDSATGELTFLAAPDFENASDMDADNNYLVEVTVKDSQNATDVQAHTITVADVNDAPMISSADTTSIAENETTVTTVTSSDQDSGDTASYSLTGGDDQILFSIDSTTGALSFITAPDFENPSDTGTDNSYIVEVTVTDAAGTSTPQTHTVTVNDAQDAPIITSADILDVAENETAVMTVTASDQDAADLLTFSLTGGDDQALFTLDPNTGELSFNVAPSFEDKQDANTDNVYEVEVSVDDGNGNVTPQLLSITVTNVNDAPVFATAEINPSINENQTAAVTVVANDEDQDTLSYSLIGGADQGLFSIVASTGEIRFITAPDFESPSDNDANNVYELDVKAVDGNGGEATQRVNISVNDIGIRFSVRAFLQGPFNGTDMSDDLRVLGLIPEQEPYTDLGHIVAGWSRNLDPNLLTTTDDDAIVDWMLLEIRAGYDMNNVLLSQAVLIQRDGDIVSADSANPVFNYDGLPAGEYYLSIRHRNHMGVMTAKISLGSVLHLADFTDVNTETGWGENERLLSADLALLWAGDANHDGAIIAQGANNDVNIILGSVFGDADNIDINSNYILRGYLSSDINMDGMTIFSGSRNDVNLMVGDVLIHPGNSNFNGNFIAQEQLPEEVEGAVNENPMDITIITGFPSSGDSGTSGNTVGDATGGSVGDTGANTGSDTTDGSGEVSGGNTGDTDNTGNESPNNPTEDPTDGTSNPTDTGNTGDVVAPNTDASINSLQTANTSPALSGTLPTGDTDEETALYSVSIRINAQYYPAINNADRTWSLTAGNIVELSEGLYDVTITVTDNAANSSSTILLNKIEINNTGFLIDSAIEGIKYVSGRFTGYTDSSGLFKYDGDAPVMFYIGSEETGIPLGNAATKVDPYNAKRRIIDLFDLTGTADENNRQIVNMARFLQSLDVDKDPSNGITIDQKTRESIALLGLKDTIRFDVDIDNFEQDENLYGLFNDLADHFGEHRGLIATEDAKAHIVAVRDNTLPTVSYDADKVRGNKAEIKILTGVFKSTTGIVEGLEYRSGNQFGRTSTAGEFQYEEGKTVKFSIYQLELGITEGKATITPADLIVSTSFDHPKPRNIVRLLASFDAIQGDEKITIDNAVREALEKYRSQIDLNLSDGQANEELGIPAGENEFLAQFENFEIGKEILDEIDALRVAG